MTQLSVVIPVYNEAATIGTILREVANVLPEVSKQIIIVDDCSGDGTADWLRRNLGSQQGVWQGIAVNDDGGIGRFQLVAVAGEQRDVPGGRQRNQGGQAHPAGGVPQPDGAVT